MTGVQTCALPIYSLDELTAPGSTIGDYTPATMPQINSGLMQPIVPQMPDMSSAPSLPAMNSLPQMPPSSNLPSMPQMPPIPQMPPAAGQYQPQMPQMPPAQTGMMGQNNPATMPGYGAVPQYPTGSGLKSGPSMPPMPMNVPMRPAPPAPQNTATAPQPPQAPTAPTNSPSPTGY